MGEILSSLSFSRDEEGGGYLIQYSRVVMTKVLFICAVLCVWRGDRADLTCHVHDDNEYKDVIQQVIIIKFSILWEERADFQE